MNATSYDIPQTILPPSANAVLSALENAGFEAWAVGGFVRDSLLGRPVHDCDIATNAYWQQVQKVCETAGMHTFETGVDHGTISVLVPQEKPRDIVEVTTYRSEGSYSDARHPDSVEFVQTIEEDLARRDFTINAMAWHPQRGLIDPYHGKDDLQAGLLRAVGNAEERFAEDALRILRAIRFASELGFSLEENTLAGANAQLERLNLVAVERITAELNRLLCGPYAREVLLDYPTILDHVLPELAPMRGFNQKSPYHIYDVFEHTAYVVEGVSATPLLRWAALLHDSGKPTSFTVGENGQGHFYGHAKVSAEITAQLLKRLKMPQQLARDICLLVRYHDVHRPPTARVVKRMLRHLDDSPELFRALCVLQRSDAAAHAPGYTQRAKLTDEAERILGQILEENAAFSLKHLAIDGNDLLEAGIEAGPRIGQLLENALDAVVDEEIPNDHDALLAFILDANSTL